MSLNDGFMNEQKLILGINGKTYNDLNPNLKHLIDYALPTLDRDAKISCYPAEEYTKPDICISQNGVSRYISVKHGTAEGVHEEQLDRFIQFLKECNIDDYTIEGYLLYHFGDQTTDGTGTKRLDYFNVMATFKDRVDQVNQKFNESREFVKKFADRVLFQGVNDLSTPADMIYHGDEDFGSFVSKRQIMRHLELRKWSFMTSIVHIGPFVLRPKARYPNKEIKNDSFRYRVVVSYPKLVNDIMYIFNRYPF